MAALPAHGVNVVASSSVYETEPVGLVLDQREFYNACLQVGHAARSGRAAGGVQGGRARAGAGTGWRAPRTPPDRRRRAAARRARVLL